MLPRYIYLQKSSDFLKNISFKLKKLFYQTLLQKILRFFKLYKQPKCFDKKHIYIFQKKWGCFRKHLFKHKHTILI